jgi:hypothetical protein
VDCQLQPLENAIGLRAIGLGSVVLNKFEVKVQCKLAILSAPSVLATPVGKRNEELRTFVLST